MDRPEMRVVRGRGHSGRSSFARSHAHSITALVSHSLAKFLSLPFRWLPDAKEIIITILFPTLGLPEIKNKTYPSGSTSLEVTLRTPFSSLGTVIIITRRLMLTRRAGIRAILSSPLITK